MTGPRLLVHVEGETEEEFVKEVLAPHLRGLGFGQVSARLIGDARSRERRGGIRPWPGVRGDIVRHLKEDPGCVATMMVDYYGLPQTGEGAWPGRREANTAPLAKRITILETALSEDLARYLGENCGLRRFIPFVVQHEFEALLFSDCAVFARTIYRPDLQSALQAIRDCFETPEHIDDSPQTAPSKRIAALTTGYQKPLYGILAALDIGLDKIRQECPLFATWLTRLENLVTESDAVPGGA